MNPSTDNRQSGGAILLALIVIAVGGILITNWMKTKPLHRAELNSFHQYQGRILAEAALVDSLPESIVESSRYQLEELSQPEIFYSTQHWRVYHADRHLGDLQSQGLVSLDTNIWKYPLRLWGRQALQGDHRRLGESFYTQSPEDIESGYESNDLTSEWFKNIYTQLETQWAGLDSLDELEWIEGDYRLDETTGNPQGILLVEGQLSVAQGHQVQGVMAVTQGGFILENDASFQGRILTRGEVELSFGSRFEGYLGTLPQLRDSTESSSASSDSDNQNFAQIRMNSSHFNGWMFAMSGPRIHHEDEIQPVLIKDFESQFDGFVVTPHFVELHGEFHGSVQAFGLVCDLGPFCVGDLEMVEPRITQWTQVDWLQQDSSDSSYQAHKMVQWSRP